MIFYFSGTGNSQWVAQTLAQKLNDQAQDIVGLGQIPSMEQEQQVGLVFPIYAWGVPEPMMQFAGKLGKTAAFSFGVCTCGADAGLAMKKLSKIYPLDSSYSLAMPNNYIIGSEIDDDDTIVRKLSSARAELETIAGEIGQKKCVYRVQEGKHPALKSNAINMGFNKFARTTKPFYTLGTCNGCGTCEKNCPAGAITLETGRPVWKKQCYQCMRCIHNCPQTAIQYGKETAGRKRYHLRDYL